METLTVEHNASNKEIKQILFSLVAMGLLRIKNKDDNFERDLS